MTRGLRREWEVLGNEWSAEEGQGVVLGVERQAERHSGGALLLSVLVSFMGVSRGV
jgi:hypothetical protein